MTRFFALIPSIAQAQPITNITLDQPFYTAACYEVGKMHKEDGNAFAASKYFEKACALGYEAACSTR